MNKDTGTTEKMYGLNERHPVNCQKIYRKVDARGCVHVYGKHYFVSTELVGQKVAVTGTNITTKTGWILPMQKPPAGQLMGETGGKQ